MDKNTTQKWPEWAAFVVFVQNGNEWFDVFAHDLSDTDSIIEYYTNNGFTAYVL